MGQKCGSWDVEWDRHGFSFRASGRPAGSFTFRSILLPVQIVIGESPSDASRILLKLLESRQAEVLTGASPADLEQFKRRLSAEVLSAVRNTRAGCADCAREAGVLAAAWDEAACPGCHESYCRNACCLRRLRVVVREGRPHCKYCGMEVMLRQKPAERFVPPEPSKSEPPVVQWGHVPPAGDGPDRDPGKRRRNALRPRVGPGRSARQ